MTVKELRTILDEYNDGDLVVLSSDAEGNRFRKAEEHSDGSFDDEGNELVDPEVGLDHGEDGAPCVILWPGD